MSLSSVSRKVVAQYPVLHLLQQDMPIPMDQNLEHQKSTTNHQITRSSPKVTLPKFNSEFTPEKWWLEDDPFLLGR